MTKNTTILLAAAVGVFLLYKNRTAVASSLPAGFTTFIDQATGKTYLTPINEQVVGGAQPGG